MKYLDSFTLASESEEINYLWSFGKTDMQCYSQTNVYPFKIFPQKRLERLDFEPITVIYGGNGSGKSTILNLIAEKLRLERTAPFNNTPYIEEYLNFCEYKLSFGQNAPRGSRIITSDGVFDSLLDVRAINEGVDRRREALFDEYDRSREEAYLLRDLDDLEEFKRRNETKRRTKSDYVSKRLPKEIAGMSNGETAYLYFTKQIEENALYLLDEPENSLSAVLQDKLRQFIEDSARFYNCQFIISTHSPFLLSMKGAKVYDLDSVPVESKKWTELENVRLYHEFFKTHENEF
ncbi:MAG: ATP-binding cassette domain-containing protein [Ruminococcaceae bacterium]|nr:ATP-binding cassette domain-containing protein [Oscillospiraceae bacterium]